MPGGIAEPGQDGVFLVPLDAAQATDPTPFGQEGEGLNDLVRRNATTIEDRAFGFGERVTARAAQVTLATGLRLATFDDVLLPLTLLLAIVSAGFVGTEITNMDKSRHPDLPAPRMPPL